MQSYVLTVAGLAIGNLIWQALQKEPKWMVALDRTFYEAIGIIFYIITAN